MKIRNGFVSNSSSASFLVMNKNKMTEEEKQWFRSKANSNRQLYEFHESENFMELWQIDGYFESFVENKDFKCNKEAIATIFDARRWSTDSEYLDKVYAHFI